MSDYAKVLKIGNGNNQYQSNYGGGPLTLHRGVGERSSNTGSVTWSSPDKALAQGYADKRKDGKVETTTENFKSVFDAGRDSQEMTPSKFAVSAMLQAKQRGQVSDKDALAHRADFLKDQTSDSRNITDYWAKEEGRGKVSSLLRGLGFDAVHILEGDTPTFGKLGKAKKAEPLERRGGRPLTSAFTF